MQIRLFFSFVIGMALASQSLVAQRTISGIVKDSISGERLIGATVYIASNGTITDNNGFFVLPSLGNDTLHISYVGYTSVSQFVANVSDTVLELNLKPGLSINAVDVTSRRMVRNNTISLTPTEIYTLPSITGKPDVMRALQLMPGIMGQSEGSGLLLVRGGNPGENMYLFDHVPVIYVNHFGGFMSVFNPDIINGLDVYKGNFPARYGGKLSSIVNITQREGNQSGFKGSYHLGITDLSLSLEGPLNDNTTLIFAGRKTLFDLYMMAASSLIDGNGAVVFYGFHDFNTKLSWKPNAQNSFHVNLFHGDDYFNFRAKKSDSQPWNKNRLVYIWGNWMLSGGWKHIATSKLFGESSLAYSRYRNREQQNMEYRLDNVQQKRQTRYVSSVNMLSAVSAWKYFPTPGWTVNFGVNTSFASLLPVLASNSGLSSTDEYNAIPTLESALYVENILTLPHNWELTAGVRGVHYTSRSFDVLLAEPRISLQKQFYGNHRFNIGYMQVNQFSHLLFTPGSIFSNEVWIPASRSIKPAQSDQFNLGWTGGFNNNQYQAEVGLYYKTLTDLATYREGFFNLRGDPNWQEKIETGGTGEAWGAELLIRKTSGKYTGFAGYTWSRATRLFPGINGGKTWVFDFDRPHAFSININREFNKRSSVSLSWVYQSGLPYTPVIARYLVPSVRYTSEGAPYMYEAFVYGERNSGRMKDYHRLDISYTRNRFTRSDKLISSWTFGVYNAYNRQNPVYYYYNTTPSGEIINPEYSDLAYKPFNLYQMTLFPIIPAISYKYYFGQKEPGERTSIKKILNNLLFHD